MKQTSFVALMHTPYTWSLVNECIKVRTLAEHTHMHTHTHTHTHTLTHILVFPQTCEWTQMQVLTHTHGPIYVSGHNDERETLASDKTKALLAIDRTFACMTFYEPLQLKWTRPGFRDSSLRWGKECRQPISVHSLTCIGLSDWQIGMLWCHILHRFLSVG